MNGHTGCDHPFDGHAVIPTNGDPTKGGIILCPAKGCQCFSTWDVPQLGVNREDVFIPPESLIASMREQLQQ